MHIGNARVAVINWLFARKSGGAFMLRIDDTDQTRSTKEYTDALFEEVSWLGLTYDIFARQSECIERYKEAMESLISIGRLYPCYETPEELDIKRKIQAKKNEPPVYDRSALNASSKEVETWIAQGRRPHWRFKLNNAPAKWCDLVKGEITVQTAGSLSDPVLVKEDGTFLYTLSSVVDDIDFGITHIIRGEDHVTNTGVQIQLFEALTREKQGPPPIFAHLSLLLDKEGQPLSKRIGSFCLRNLRDAGFDAMAINCFIAGLGSSQSHLITYDLRELADFFDLGAIRGGARVDLDAIEGIQKKLLHIKSYEMAQASFDKHGVHFSRDEWLAIRESLSAPQDIVEWYNILNTDACFKHMMGTDDITYIRSIAKLLPEGFFDDGTWDIWSVRIKQETGRHGRDMIHPIRLALTGRASGPEMKNLILLIGRDNVTRRLLSCS
jgi:glutamyl-tRNA synthetase